MFEYLAVLKDGTERWLSEAELFTEAVAGLKAIRPVAIDYAFSA